MSSGGRAIRVAHLIAGLRLGGLERLVTELCDLGRHHEVDPLVISLGEDGPVRDQLEQVGVPVRHLADTPGMSRAALQGIAEAVGHFGAEVVHAHDLGPWLNAAAARALQPQVPVIATFHEMARPTGPKRWAARLAASFSAALVACGNEVREAVRSWAPPFCRLVTIGNGVRLPAPFSPEQRRAARARLGVPEGVVVVGYVGGLRPVKGPDLLLEAFLSRYRSDMRVHLALVGWGPLEAMLRTRAARDSNVHFTGFVADGAALLPGMDVYAQTSLSEGRSLSMLEAMAAGLPTVAHELPGVAEIHRHGVTALLAPVGDLGRVEEGLVRLVGSPELRAQLGGAAREASRAYSIEVTLGAYGALYRELAWAKA